LADALQTPLMDAQWCKRLLANKFDQVVRTPGKHLNARARRLSPQLNA